MAPARCCRPSWQLRGGRQGGGQHAAWLYGTMLVLARSCWQGQPSAHWKSRRHLQRPTPPRQAAPGTVSPAGTSRRRGRPAADGTLPRAAGGIPPALPESTQGCFAAATGSSWPGPQLSSLAGCSRMSTWLLSPTGTSSTRTPISASADAFCRNCIACAVRTVTVSAGSMHDSKHKVKDGRGPQQSPDARRQPAGGKPPADGSLNPLDRRAYAL